MKICLLLIFLPFVFCLPSLPSHSFDKRIFLSKKSVYDDMVGDHSVTTKKVFITFVQGPYIFKKRREKGNRVTFTCNGCQKVNHYLISLKEVSWLLARCPQHGPRRWIHAAIPARARTSSPQGKLPQDVGDEEDWHASFLIIFTVMFIIKERH